jgi:hypothetical protein
VSRDAATQTKGDVSPFSDGRYFYDANGDMTPCDAPRGAHRLGMENMAETCMQGRGVMIDLETHYGCSGRIVGHADLMEITAQDRIVVEKGDFVLSRTGFSELLLEMKKQPDRQKLVAAARAPNGRDEKFLQWVTESCVVALISDNFAVDATPVRRSRCMRDVSSSSSVTLAKCFISPNWTAGYVPIGVIDFSSRGLRFACLARPDRPRLRSRRSDTHRLQDPAILQSDAAHGGNASGRWF